MAQDEFQYPVPHLLLSNKVPYEMEVDADSKGQGGMLSLWMFNFESLANVTIRFQISYKNTSQEFDVFRRKTQNPHFAHPPFTV